MTERIYVSGETMARIPLKFTADPDIKYSEGRKRITFISTEAPLKKLIAVAMTTGIKLSFLKKPRGAPRIITRKSTAATEEIQLRLAPAPTTASMDTSATIKLLWRTVKRMPGLTGSTDTTRSPSTTPTIPLLTEEAMMTQSP